MIKLPANTGDVASFSVTPIVSPVIITLDGDNINNNENLLIPGTNHRFLLHQFFTPKNHQEFGFAIYSM